MRKLKVNLNDLLLAWECSSVESTHFLDLETGDVTLVTDEDNSAVESFYDQADIQKDESEETIHAMFENWLNDYDCPAWQGDSIRSAFQIERQDEQRFIRIPIEEPHDGYQDMVDFASTVKDQHLQNSLSIALDGKKAFRRFKDVLYNYPQEQERWYKYSQDCKEQRAREWLESEGIEI